MTKNIAFLLTIVVLGIPFWLGFNTLQSKTENFFYERELANNPSELSPGKVLTAQIAEQVPEYPTYPELESYQLQADSAISVETNIQGEGKIIFQKNIDKKLPIASLTKLMTALVALEFYQESEQIEVSKKAVEQLEKTGYLKPGEILRPEELLYIMLVESSNDAAYGLTGLMGVDGFVGLMNLKAKDLGMLNTYFYNPNGVDPDDLRVNEDEINYSTVGDLVKLSEYLLKEQPKILEISSKKQYDLYLTNGSFHHTLYNTNELLGELNDVVGSKTGLTDRAGGCLLLVLKGKTPGTYLINVILNSPERFLDMRKLMQLTASGTR